MKADTEDLQYICSGPLVSVSALSTPDAICNILGKANV